jgi:CheY-like chemotaxis protein
MGAAALAEVAAASVDAIVLDIAMPEPNGLECAGGSAPVATTPRF